VKDGQEDAPRRGPAGTAEPPSCRCGAGEWGRGTDGEDTWVGCGLSECLVPPPGVQSPSLEAEVLLRWEECPLQGHSWSLQPLREPGEEATPRMCCVSTHFLRHSAGSL
jgi:hypothetical protein